jgi:hypothetical protein
MPGVYYGVISVRTETTIYNEFGHGFTDSEEHFLGLLLKRARASHPQGEIVNTAAYRVEDSVIRDAARHLEDS